MSYDVRLVIDTGGSSPVVLTDRNMTSNVSRMWREAGADLASFDGLFASAPLPLLRNAVAAMEDAPETYKAMNPPNGWGDYDSCLSFLRELIEDCLHHPKAIMEVTH